MKAKQIRLCIECGKQHDTGVEDKTTGAFDRIDKCIDCLMSKCSFKFKEKQVTLENTEQMTYDEMQEQLGKNMIELLRDKYGTPCASCELYKNDPRTPKHLPCPDCGKYR